MKPAPGFVKVNTDGAFDPVLRGAATGVIARDFSGTVLGGCFMTLICPDSASAEALAIFEGLRLAAANGWSNVILETDSASIANKINNAPS